MKGWLLWIMAGALVVGIVGTSLFMMRDHKLQTSPATAKKAGAPLPVQVVEATQTLFTEIIGVTGEIQPVSVVNLRAPMSTRVQHVEVDIGQIVTQGQVLLVFDHELLEAELATANAAVDKANRDVALAGRKFDRELLDAELATAQSQLDQAEGDLSRADDNHKAWKAHGLKPQQVRSFEVEQAKAALDAAQVRYHEAQEKFLLATKNLSEMQERVQADLESARFRYREATEERLRAEKNLHNATVKSPVSGMVMERLIQEGETPKAAEMLFTVGRIDQVLVEGRVPEERIGDVFVEQTATVTSPAFPNALWNGKVVKIKPVADPDTKTFLVYVKLDNPKLRLKPGLTGLVRIASDRPALVIPSIALINPTGVRESVIFVVGDDGVARHRKVHVGVSSQGMTEILSGIREGEQVVTVGQLLLQDGLEVRIGDEFHNDRATEAQDDVVPR